MKAIGREDLFDDPRMVDGPTRAQHREAVDAAITEWTSKRTKLEVTRIIAGAGVPCGAVMTTLELLHDPDLHARGMMQKIEHPVRGPVIVPGWPLRMSDSKVPLKCAPILGAELRGDLWRVARLLPRRGQGHAARQGDLRTAILPAAGIAHEVTFHSITRQRGPARDGGTVRPSSVGRPRVMTRRIGQYRFLGAVWHRVAVISLQ